MVLTGKQSLDFSGGVSAEDNFGIGGYDRVMGPNGQAQYWAPDLAGRLRRPAGALRPHLRRARASASRAGRPTTDPVDRDVSRLPARDRRTATSRTVGEIFSAEHQPGPQEAVRHPHGDARRRRPGPPGRSSAGPAWPTPRPRSCWTPTSAAIPVCLLGIESRPVPRRGLPAHRRPGHLDRGHAVPAVVEEDRARDQRRQRQPPARRAGEPVRLRRLAGVDAQAAARVRRRDRPGDRQLRRPDRVLRGLALPRRRVRGVLQGAQHEHGGARASRARTPR